jgi:hypothetical protein
MGTSSGRITSIIHSGTDDLFENPGDPSWSLAREKIMSDYYTQENQESISERRARKAAGSTIYDLRVDSPSSAYFPDLPSSLSHGYLGGRGNGERTAQVLRGAQRTYGNRSTQRFIQRSDSKDEELGDGGDGLWMGWLRRVGNAVLGDSPDTADASEALASLQSGLDKSLEFMPKPVPGRGEIGHVEAYTEQPAARYDSDGVRITENEHIIPGGNLKAMTHNPRTGQPDYGDAHYRKDATVRVSREMALDKTHGNRGGPNADNPRTKALKERVARGEGIDYRRDVFEASIENARRARDATGATDLTDEAINRGALAQDANLFDMQQAGESGDIVRDLGSQVEDFDIIEYDGPNSANPDLSSGEQPATRGGGPFRPDGVVGRSMSRALSGANYGLPFLGNLIQGQGIGEAASGAAVGGFTGNAIGNHLFSKSPKAGWTDTVMNLANSGLHLAGAPEEIGGVTQAAADATPTSFGTSVASNAARGLWNVGKGFFTGDWSSLKQQGEDITHGRAGAPLQGYGLALKAFLSDGIGQSRMVEDIDEGEYGILPRAGSALGGAAHDAVVSTAGTMKRVTNSLIQLQIASDRAAKRRAQIEHAKLRDAEREHEIQSRLFRISTDAALDGSEATTDDIATQLGQDRRLQFLLMSGGKCYE